MRNSLYYYYGLDVSGIHQRDNVYYFNHDGYDYIMTICEKKNINDIYEYSLYLHSINVPCHEFILNSSNTLLTTINNYNYVLMKVFVPDRKTAIDDIIFLNNVNYIGKLPSMDWYMLWTTKVDYLEYQMNQMGKKHPLLRDSFSYYIGLAENAISLVHSVKQHDYCLNHERVSDNLRELYNPLNFVIDTKYRDICEYIKQSFYKNVSCDIVNYIDNYIYDYNDACLFFSRMLFPTYYFDLYEKIINDIIDDSSLNSIIDRVNDFELFLKDIYIYLKNKFNIPNFDWLIR